MQKYVIKIYFVEVTFWNDFAEVISLYSSPLFSAMDEKKLIRYSLLKMRIHQLPSR